MNGLIPVTVNDNNEQVISGRALYEFLEISTKYEDWFPRMCEYGFVENVDWHALKIENVVNNRVYIKTDHAIKIDMAKEISMIQRNDKGKQARRYFIEVEKAWNDPEAILKRANKLASPNADLLKAMEMIFKTPTSRVNLLLPVLNKLVPGEYERFMVEDTKPKQKSKTEPKPVTGDVVAFLNDYGAVDGKPTNEVYISYYDYCAEHKIKPIPHIEFSKQVNRTLRTNIADKKIKGIKYRIFTA